MLLGYGMLFEFLVWTHLSPHNMVIGMPNL
jgi:hypothetical protein